MNVSQIEQIILNNTFSKTDYLRRLTILREFLEKKYFSDGNMIFLDFLNQIKASQHDREATALWDVNFFNLFTKDNLYLVINSLVASLKSLPILTVYLPVMLDDYQIDELGRWFRTNINPEVLMDIKINLLLVSGCAYVWKGKYHDLSLHFFLSKKQSVINKIIEAYAAENL